MRRVSFSLCLMALLALALLTPVSAFPSMLRRRFQLKSILGGLADQGNNADAAVQPQVSTTGGTNNLQWVPDAAHAFQAPQSTDKRGPCPGLNAAANHGYLPRNGIVTLDQLVQAQQQVFNVAPDLGLTLAVIAVALDGDVLSERVSLGAAADSQTNSLGALGAVLGREGGLNNHNTFEADASLTRNDYYLSPDRNNFAFNGTLYKQMKSFAAQNGGLYNFDTMASYRYQRYLDSIADNGQFYFGPKVTLLYGAAAFLYRLMPNSTGLEGYGVPDEASISSFFGASYDATTDSYTHVPERIPANWRTRTTPYTLLDVVTDLNLMYLEHPAPFGVSTSRGNFVPSGAVLSNGVSTEDINGVGCALYQIILDNVPSEFDNVAITPLTVTNYIVSKLNPAFAQFGCQH